MKWIIIAGKNLAKGAKLLRQRLQRNRTKKGKKQTVKKSSKSNSKMKQSEVKKVQSLNDNAKFQVIEQGKNLKKMGVKKGVEASQPSKPNAVPDVRPNSDYELKGVQKSRGSERSKGFDL